VNQIVVAVVGRSGQLARALVRCRAEGGPSIVPLGRPDLDITKPHSVMHAIEDLHPQVVVNAAAYTDVDKAESEPDAAFEVNAHGPAMLAETCKGLDIPLVHVSSDYVFDGTKRAPYSEDDVMTPISVYGASKAAGEAAIRVSHPKHLILRTSWVYGPEGHNFVRAMLRLAQSHDEIGVVDDQIGSPTSADDLARIILGLVPRMIGRRADMAWGTYHCSGSGAASRYGFAREIFRLSAAAGHRVPKLLPILSSEYPTPARRPAYSVLDNSKIGRVLGIASRPWQASLADCMHMLEPAFERGVPA
jgi:dTDP-4-dehydrorhamnose reductase